jgi:Flp pilus assembly protein TadG
VYRFRKFHIGAFCSGPSGSLRRILSSDTFTRLAHDRRGSVAIMFGLASLVVVSVVGSAVDYGRALLARDRLQATLDSTVLAAARVWQLEQDMTLAQQKAIAHFDAMKPEGVEAKLTKLEPDMQNNTLTVEATAAVQAPFLSLVLDGQPLRISTRAQAKFCVGCRGGGGGGNDGYDIEVAMMLDVTGSMAGSKIADLKEAAKDLVKILVWDDQSEHTSRIAVVPFSHAVNAGKQLGKAIAYSPADKVSFAFRDGKSRDWYRPKNTKDKVDPYAYCVSERQGSAAYTDATPTGNARLPVVYYSSASVSNCQPTAEVMPLTSDKQALTSLIDSFKADGFTGGNLGTAWAWYMLSPTWWSGIAANIHADGRPAAYPSLPENCTSWEKCPASQRAPGTVKKFAVLMTDGEYNMQFCDGGSKVTGASIPDRNAGPGNSEKGNCTSALATSSAQAQSLCTAMKKAGIIVYTVGFGLGTSGAQVDLLKACASEDGHFSKPSKLFYNTQTGTELRSAFRHIATSIASLYVSQ